MPQPHTIESTWDEHRAFVPPSNAWVTRVVVPRKDEYEIVVRPGLLEDWAEVVGGIQRGRSAVWVITDRTVWELHGPKLLASQAAQDLVQGVFVLPAGESSKSLDAWREVLDWLRGQHARRRDVIVAFGGSMVSDIAGFAAASYMRGVPYVNIPTSLIAQVDGAMGGKVAVNTPAAKNLVGAFHHPLAVIVDSALLATLPRAELANGLAEAIKTAAIGSPAAFDFIADRVKASLAADIVALADVVRVCASIKMHLLDPDPYEVDLKRVLNFGHTVGHAIETATAYFGVRHGEAVAIGMAVAGRLGHQRGLTSDKVRDRISGTLSAAELPIWGRPGTAASVVERLQMIQAIRDGSLRFVVPLEIGRMAILDDVSGDEIEPLIEPPVAAGVAAREPEPSDGEHAYGQPPSARGGRPA